MRCRCGGEKGRCLTMPWVIRHPETGEPLQSSKSRNVKNGENHFGDDKAQVTSLWTGVKRACQKKQSYFVNFPEDADKNMRATLTGASLLIDMSFTEDS